MGGRNDEGREFRGEGFKDDRHKVSRGTVSVMAEKVNEDLDREQTCSCIPPRLINVRVAKQRPGVP